MSLASDSPDAKKKKEPEPKCLSRFKYMFHTTEEHYDLASRDVRPGHIWGGIRAHTTSHGIPHIDNARG